MTLKGTAPKGHLAKEHERQLTSPPSLSALGLDQRARFSPAEVSAVGTLVRLHRRDTNLPTHQALPLLCRDFHQFLKILLAERGTRTPGGQEAPFVSRGRTLS